MKSKSEQCQDCQVKPATRIYCSPNDSQLLLCDDCISQREFRDKMLEADSGVLAKSN